MKIKRNRKLMSILLTLSLLVAMLVPMVAPASAAVTYSMTSTNKIAATGTATGVGALVVTMDGASAKVMAVNDAVYLDLPSTPAGFVLAVGAAGVSAVNGSGISGGIAGGGAGGIIPNGTFTAANTTTNNELKLTYASAVSMDASSSLIITVPLTITVPTGVSGPINLTATAKSSSAFSSGTVVVANVGTGTVTLSSETVPTIDASGNDTIGVIDVKEDIRSALSGSSGNSTALSLTLPPGITWNTATTSLIWGDSTLAAGIASISSTAPAVGTPYLITSNNGRELDLKWNGYNSGTALAPLYESSSPSFLKITGTVTVDESTAKQGEVDVAVGGDSTSSVSSLVVGNYGTFGLSSKAFSSTNLIAGQAGQKTGEFEVDETTPGSLITGRTITLTLPSNVEWANSTPSIDTTNSQNTGGLQINNSTYPIACEGSSANVLRITMAGTVTNTNPAKLVIKNLEVTPALDFTGDLVATVAGSEGLTGTVTLAKVSAPVSATAASTPNVIIGQSAQNVGDITLTEAGAGYVSSTITTSSAPSSSNSVHYTTDNTTTSGETQLTIEAPSGVSFASTPTVKVTDGDLQIDTASTDTGNNNKGLLYIKIKSSSTKPATISISGIQVNVDRTVPAGDILFTVKGNAVNQTYTDATMTDTLSLFPGHNGSVQVKVGTITTPAPENQKQTAVFTIGSTDFTLNGAKTTMDAAPYLKNDRTYLPIRFVAQSVGVTDSNIIWNGDDQSVTLIKGGSVVKLTVGSTTMTINGTPITMDVAPEIVDPGRVMLPVRWVGQALGCSVNWDAATQTVTVN